MRSNRCFYSWLFRRAMSRGWSPRTLVVSIAILSILGYLLFYHSPQSMDDLEPVASRLPVVKSLGLPVAKSQNTADINQEDVVLTHKGPVSYEDLERLVFEPLGYGIDKPTAPIATLRFVQHPKCEKWLAIANTYDAKQKPPKQIPANLTQFFTLFGHSKLMDYYFDDRSSSGKTTWPKADIDRRVKWADIHSQAGYPGEGDAVFFATLHHDLRGKTGLVIGSLSPWVEAYLLRNGAEKVITVEYKQISTDHPKLGYYHPIEMAKKWQDYNEKFDFAVSFSSIEHSGLGRFGDPLDPIGDLREMQKTWCQLKPGGLFFIGFPTGQDRVVYNAHRVYGRIRLALMFAGWELLDTFYGKNQQPTPITVDILHNNGTDHSAHSGVFGPQFIFVLRKPK